MKLGIRSNLTVICGVVFLLLTGCGENTNTRNTELAYTNSKYQDFTGFSKKSDELLIVKNELNLDNGKIKEFYFLDGSQETIMKVSLSTMPCSMLLKKNNTSSGLMWSVFDMSCDENEGDYAN